MATIDYIDGGAIIETPQVSFTYQTSQNPRDFEKMRGLSDSLDWSDSENYIGDYVVYPFGTNNNLPNVIKNVIYNNYIAPGLFKRKSELLWGLGPKLYKESIKDGRVVKEWVQEPTIQKWLESWDYETYMNKVVTDYQHIEATYTRFEQTKGYIIGRPFIKALHHVLPDKARLARVKESNISDPTHVIVTNWAFNNVSSLEKVKTYPLLNTLDPLRYPNAIYYSNLYSFCSDYYTIPSIYGSLEWLNVSTSVPLIFKALNRNTANLKYHIQSPSTFWDKRRQEIQNNCAIKQIPYDENMLLAYQNEFLTKMSEVLVGMENTGKFLHTTKELSVNGMNVIELGWEIQVIDQKVKDFVESQIKISERADYAVSAGIGLDSSLAKISGDSKANSGSEHIYSLINYLNTGIDIAEMIITKAINIAIKSNFPDSNVKIGFYHNVPEKQQDVSPQDRSLNNSN